MTLYKRGNLWWVEYQVNGRRYRQSTHATNKAIALAWANQIETARKMPTFEEAVQVLRMMYHQPCEGAIPIDAIWDTYLGVAKATGKDAIAPLTMTRRRNIIERLVRWLHSQRATIRTAEAVTGPIAAAFASELATQGLKSKTRINIISELCTVWKTLENASTRVRNPWSTLRPIDTDGRRGEAFSREQEEAVIQAAKKVGKDWWQICTIMRHTGLRYGSVARLRWAEIDGGVLRHMPEKTKRHGITVAIPLIEPVREAIATLDRRGEWLFPLHAELYGNRGRAAREALNFREVLSAAGIDGEGFTVHSWRHTAATRLAEAGADIETRKRILGHTVDATAERYDHAEHLEAVKDAIEKAR